MTRSRYPRSVATYIRRQKGWIRRHATSKEEAEKRIQELLASVRAFRKDL